jgi:hypothetical protein
MSGLPNTRDSFGPEQSRLLVDGHVAAYVVVTTDGTESEAGPSMCWSEISFALTDKQSRATTRLVERLTPPKTL